MNQINDLTMNLVSAAGEENPATALDRLAGLYKLAASYISMLEETRDSIRKEIDRRLQETGLTEAITSVGRISYAKRWDEVTWDTKGLAQFISTDPGLAQTLAPFQKTVSRGGYLIVK